MKRIFSGLIVIVVLMSCKKTTTSTPPSGIDSSNHDTTSNLNAGLVAYYTFTGNTIDSTSNHLNGTIHGNAYLVKDRFGNPNSAYYFNGNVTYVDTFNAYLPNEYTILHDSSSYIQVPDNPVLHFTTNNALSISIWAKITTNTRTIRSLRYGLNAQMIVIAKTDSFTSNQTGFRAGIIGHSVPDNLYGTADFIGVNVGLITKDNILETSTNIVDPTIGIDTSWHHIVFTLNNSGIGKTYFDGVLVDSSTSNQALTDNTSDLFIGKCNPDIRPNINLEPNMPYNYISGFTGYLDDIRIYNRAITSSEVSVLYYKSN